MSLAARGALSTTGDIYFAGGTLQFTSANTTDYSGRIGITIASPGNGQISGAGPGAISLDTNGQNVTFASALVANSTAGLTKIGAGTLTLTAANLYTGAPRQSRAARCRRTAAAALIRAI